MREFDSRIPLQMKLDFSKVLYAIKKQKEFGVFHGDEKIGVIVERLDSINSYEIGEVCFFTDMHDGKTVILSAPMPKEIIGKRGYLTTQKTIIGVPKSAVREVNPRLKNVYKRLIVDLF